MWTAIKAGRTVATSGPLLLFTANGKTAGETIAINSDQPQTVAISTFVRSLEYLEAIDVVHNGRVVASGTLQEALSDPIVEGGLDFKLTPQRRGWIVTRALYRAPDGLLRQAHSSPVYISVDGKPAASAADARYMLRWIDHLAESAKSDPKRFPDADARNSVLGIYAEASARYEKIIEDARKHWAD